MLRYLRIALFVLIPGITALGQTHRSGGSALNNQDSAVASQSSLSGSTPSDWAIRGVYRVDALNSPARDNNPIITADGNMLFFNSTRYGNRAWAKYDTTERRYDEDIYYAIRLSNKLYEEVWSAPINLGPKINSTGDDGIETISPDGHSIYFTSLKHGWEYDGGPFYMAELRGREWTGITGLGGGINEFFTNRDKSKRFKIYGASISSDGKDFYFATTAFNEQRHQEIWVSHRLKNGEWGAPESVGAEINASGGSYAPYIAADNKTLFFSSRRTGGYGGDDIYMSELKNGQWQPPVNLGNPMNSRANESFISLSASGERVYISSSRLGNDDIYTVPPPQTLRPINVILLRGCITDKRTHIPVEASVIVEDLQTGAKMFDVGSNSSSGEYLVVLQPGRQYGITVSAPNYVFISDHYMIPANARYTELTKNFQMKQLHRGERFIVNNIFFNYNSSDLSDLSYPELHRLAELLQEYSTIKIEIGGYTDNVGSPVYNKQLSSERAQAVRNYLVNVEGIDGSRITVRGYGSANPVASNTTEEGRSANRRTEFVVKSGMLPPK